MWSVIIILVLLIPLAAVVLDSKLGQALARRVEGGADDARLRALETEVAQLNAQVERIQEQSEFLTRLLEERPERAAGDPLPPGGSLPPGGRQND